MLWCLIVRRLDAASNAGCRWRCGVLLALAACAQADSTPPDTSGGGVAGAAGAAALSDAEWRELTGPRPGVHEVYSSACAEQPIGQDYRVIPPLECIERRDEEGRSTLIRDCAIADYCTTAADCTAQPRGVCTGSMNDACVYPSVEQGAPCARDTDCNALSAGACTPRIEGGGQLCYPTGECSVTPMQGCTYPALLQPCVRDEDCTAAPGGSCQRTISFARCAYNECDVGSDCGPAARCECFGVRQCIPASCFADSECEAGHRCEPTLALVCGNLNAPVGYHCHSAADECQSDADCGNLSCVFDPEVSRWACRDNFCTTR
jgi:hypothetical protein